MTGSTDGGRGGVRGRQGYRETDLRALPSDLCALTVGVQRLETRRGPDTKRPAQHPKPNKANQHDSKHPCQSCDTESSWDPGYHRPRNAHRGPQGGLLRSRPGPDPDRDPTQTRTRPRPPGHRSDPTQPSPPPKQLQYIYGCMISQTPPPPVMQCTRTAGREGGLGRRRTDNRRTALSVLTALGT